MALAVITSGVGERKPPCEQIHLTHLLTVFMAVQLYFSETGCKCKQKAQGQNQ